MTTSIPLRVCQTRSEHLEPQKRGKTKMLERRVRTTKYLVFRTRENPWKQRKTGGRKSLSCGGFRVVLVMPLRYRCVFGLLIRRFSLNSIACFSGGCNCFSCFTRKFSCGRGEKAGTFREIPAGKKKARHRVIIFHKSDSFCVKNGCFLRTSLLVY